MKFSKGVELPMNTLVVVAIAVIILLAMTAFFIGVFGPTQKGTQSQQELNNACLQWTRVGCDENEEYIIKKVCIAYNKTYSAQISDINKCLNNEDGILNILKTVCNCGINLPEPLVGGGGQGSQQSGG